MKRLAVYPGSFDPFTNGHLDIVKKAAAVFERLIVLVAINSNKRRSYDAGRVKCAIEETLAECGLTNCEVIVFDGLIANYTRENRIGYMVRGLRNNMDYNYEENIAEINKLIDPKLEYVYFRANNVAVSSSMVKELYTYGQDVSAFVPRAVKKMLEG